MLKRIFSYMKQYKKYAFLALFCIAVEAVLELMVPMIMADLIDTGVATGDERYIYQKGFQMVLCAAAALVLGIGSARFAALAGQGLGANLREAEYEKIAVVFICQYRPFQGIVDCDTFNKRCHEYSECRFNRYAPVWQKSGHADFCNGRGIFH